MMSTSDIVRADVEGVTDYHLRLARLAEHRRFLAKLEAEAETIRAYDLPLWFVQTITRTYAHRGFCEVGCHILIRSDAPSVSLEKIDRLCRSGSRCRDSRLVMLGNVNTPHRQYWYVVSDYTGTEISKVLLGLLGPTADLPVRDAEGGSLPF